MNLSNGILSVEICSHGAELKSAVKNGFEYMWCGDEKYWGRTSPVLFPFVGGLKDKKYRLGETEHSMGQHGFARDCEFELTDKTETSVSYILKSDENSKKIYPFEFELLIKYTLVNSTIKVEWTVENKDEKEILFSIGAHPGFNLKDGDNYFKFDNKNDIVYNLIDENGLYKDEKYVLQNSGCVKIESSMFDNDALIIEDEQAKEVSLCDSKKNPYVTVRFDAPLFGLWSPAKKNAPFVCIEPWYGRCDRTDFCGELSEKDYIMKVSAGDTFKAEYEIELL